MLFQHIYTIFFSTFVSGCLPCWRSSFSSSCAASHPPHRPWTSSALGGPPRWTTRRCSRSWGSRSRQKVRQKGKKGNSKFCHMDSSYKTESPTVVQYVLHTTVNYSRHGSRQVSCVKGLSALDTLRKMTRGLSTSSSETVIMPSSIKVTCTVLVPIL